jgi:hypothetical protein
LRASRYKQIPSTFEADIGRHAVERHHLVEFGEKIQPVAGHEDILGQAEKLADAAVGRRCCRERIAWVRLDDRDRPGPSSACQKIGNRRTDNAAADDGDVHAHEGVPRLELTDFPEMALKPLLMVADDGALGEA